MDLSDKQELRWLSAVLADVGGAALDTEFLIVGAIARDLLLHYGHGVPITRATADIDLGVAVGSWDEFRRLRDACLESGHFTPDRPGNHRIIHRSGVPLDLIPFGGVEREDGTIEWPDDNAVMGVLGYREASATATQVQLPEKMPVATVCLPMLAVLKLMAWSERHTYTPRKDASDLFLVLGNYLNDENTARLYEVGAHLLERKNFDYEAAGAWLAGHDAHQCIANHSEQPRRVLDAVENVLLTESDANGNLRLVGEAGARAPTALRLLGGFQDGIIGRPA
ncbi:MAG: nucleotidyl transferase AbiEii/AbiGii toxin family protein [Woeseiaceae bacterium]|nr:nucleotidyl transferase AbiEii/AbiGii toxin family protein [Woeseiaceae bacterium]